MSFWAEFFTKNLLRDIGVGSCCVFTALSLAHTVVSEVSLYQAKRMVGICSPDQETVSKQVDGKPKDLRYKQPRVYAVIVHSLFFQRNSSLAHTS